MTRYNLPDNVLKIIFGYLDFDQLLEMRAISLRFSSIIDKIIEQKPLWIKKTDDNSNYFRFFCVNKTYCSSQFNVSHSLLLFRASEFIHSKITKMITYNPFVLRNLKLENLTHLEIKNNHTIVKGEEDDQDEPDYSEEPQKEEDDCVCDEQSAGLNLQFKKLKTLCLAIRSDVNFIIESDSLIELKTLYNLDKVVFLQPMSLKVLCCHELTDEVTEFKSLHKLLIDRFIYRKNQQTNIVKQLDKLRVLHISNTNRATFDKLVEQAEVNPKLKIFFKNVRVDAKQFDFDLVDEINAVSLNNSHYSTYLAFADSLKGEPRQTSLFLSDRLKGDLDLLSKFVNLRCLHVNTEAISFNDWIRILGSLRLTKLYVSGEYEQAFLDVLPKLCGYLNCLVVTKYENLDFLFELRYLERITFPDLLSVELFRKLMRSLPDLKTVRFDLKDTCYRFEFTKEMVSLNKNSKKVFSETRNSFLSTTIAGLNSWSELFTA